MKIIVRYGDKIWVIIVVFEKGHEFYIGGERGWFKKEQSPFNKGTKMSYWMPKESNELRKKKISETLKKKFASGERVSFFKGRKKELHPNYQDGSCSYRRYIEIKECSDCGSTKNLHVHHLDHNRHNNNILNLMVYCTQCHLKKHWEERKIIYSSCCGLCGNSFDSKIHNKKYCSIHCQQKDYRQKKRGG